MLSDPFKSVPSVCFLMLFFLTPFTSKALQADGFGAVWSSPKAKFKRVLFEGNKLAIRWFIKKNIGTNLPVTEGSWPLIKARQMLLKVYLGLGVDAINKGHLSLEDVERFLDDLDAGMPDMLEHGLDYILMHKKLHPQKLFLFALKPTVDYRFFKRLKKRRKLLDLDINAKNDKGKTPFMVVLDGYKEAFKKDNIFDASAVMSKQASKVAFLLELGADLNVKDHAGRLTMSYIKEVAVLSTKWAAPAMPRDHQKQALRICEKLLLIP